MFSVRYEAAKLIEEEQEAEMDEAERHKSLMPAAVTRDSTDHASQTGGGGWYESESGLFWEPPGDSSVLDSSSDGLAAMHAARQQAAALAATTSSSNPASSQLDDDETYTRGLSVCAWDRFIRHSKPKVMSSSNCK